MHCAIPANRSLLLVVFAGLLSACSEPEQTASMATALVTDFSCADGSRFQVTFFPDKDFATLERDGQRVELQRQRTASGFHYTGAGFSVRGKGSEIMFTAGESIPLRCNAKP